MRTWRWNRSSSTIVPGPWSGFAAVVPRRLLARRPDDPAFWDMMVIQIRATFDPPEDWVPELAVILERYRENEEASTMVTTRLIEMGLLRLVSSPDRPGEVMLDSRILQQLLGLYGPKVTTSSGYLGVSATRGEIWTPQSSAQGLRNLDPRVGSGNRQEW